MAKMTGFVFQDEYLDKLAKLSDQEVGRLIRALAKYHMTGEEQELLGRESIAYDFIKDDVDRIEQKYQAKCEKNRQIRQQALTNDNERKRTSTNDDKDKVKDKDKDIKETTLKGSKEKRTRFSPPTVDEVSSYCRERGNHVDAQRFVDFYESKGWRIGNNPMKDWKAAVRTWEQRDNKPAQQPRLLRSQQYEQREYHESEMAETLGVDDLFKGAAG